MTFGTIAMMTPWSFGQDPDTPKKTSNAKNVDDSGGLGTYFGGNSTVNPGGSNATSVFKPGKVKVDDARGTETKGATPGGGGSKSVFKPGQTKVDDTRGTEVKTPPVVAKPATPSEEKKEPYNPGYRSESEPPPGYYWDYSDVVAGGGGPDLKPIPGYRPSAPPPEFDPNDF